jgi:ribosome-associated heat shock protein Hsp15
LTKANCWLDDDAQQRIDKWLWHARLVKSRSLAAKLVADGAIRVNRAKVLKASALVKRGDVLTAAIHGRVRVLEVAGFSARRGSASEALGLYREHGGPEGTS